MILTNKIINYLVLFTTIGSMTLLIFVAYHIYGRGLFIFADKNTPPPLNLHENKKNKSLIHDKEVDIKNAYNLFGETKKEKKQPQVISAPVTKLAISLQGVIAAPGQNSQAMIGIKNKKNSSLDVYGLGENLMEGVLIKAIYNNKVILERNGELESLYLEDDKNEKNTLIDTAKITTTSPLPKQKPKPDTVNKKTVKAIANMPQAIKQLSPSRWKIKKSLLQSHLKNIEQQFDDITINYIPEKGWLIKDIDENSTLVQLGLKDFDIIQQVNQLDFKNNESFDSKTINTLETAVNIRVIIQRDNQKKIMRYSIR